MKIVSKLKVWFDRLSRAHYRAMVFEGLIFCSKEDREEILKRLEEKDGD